MNLSRRTFLAGSVGAGVIAAAGPATATPTTPPPSDPSARRDMIASRRRFFGAENVDPTSGAVRSDKVILSWFGCTSFAASLGGTVVLLDAWVPRGSSSGYVPTTVDEIISLQPEAIFLGHGHFDHAGDAGTIVQGTGATLFGTAEHIRTVRKSVPGLRVRGVELGSAAGGPGSKHVHRTGALEITAVKHLHSTPVAPDRRGAGSAPFFPVPDLRDSIAHPPLLCDVVDTGRALFSEEGGSLLYQFRLGEFALTWNDSVGPLSDAAPEVFDVLRGLAPTTVHVGAIQGFNQITNGLRDVRQYIEAIGADIFVPSHHDNWLPGFTARGATYRTALGNEFHRLPASHRPELLFLNDPADYIRPAALTFSL